MGQTADTTEQDAADEPASHESGPLVITLDDLRTTNVEAPIAEIRSVNCVSFGEPYRKAASAAEGKDDRASKVYGLLGAVTQMHCKPEDRGEPYGPLFVMNGRRSIIPDDLRGEQSAVFAAIAPGIRNPGLRALLADIAWLNDRKLSASGQLAIAAFTEAVALVADGKAEFQFDEHRATSNTGIDMLRRACQIASGTGWKAPEGAVLRDLITSLTQAAFDSGDGYGYLNVATLSQSYGITDAGVIAEQAEALAGTDGLFPETARHMLELAAAAHRRRQDEAESNRCLANAAECYVTMAAAAGFKGMTAASWLMDAIGALRRVPGTKQRRSELEAQLREAQGSIADEMGVISTEIDLKEIVDHTRKVIGDLTLPQAFAEFIRLDQSAAPETLRKEAREQAEKPPFG